MGLDLEVFEIFTSLRAPVFPTKSLKFSWRLDMVIGFEIIASKIRLSSRKRDKFVFWKDIRQRAEPISWFYLRTGKRSNQDRTEKVTYKSGLQCAFRDVRSRGIGPDGPNLTLQPTNTDVSGFPSHTG